MSGRAARWKRPLRHGWAPAPRLQRAVLFVNPRSGEGKAERAGLAEHARDRAVEAVVLSPDADVGALAAGAVARGADALGVAGGDGSLAAVASVALANGLPFVCIPAGTRNHFALDVGVDRRDVIGALDAFADGVERMIDVAQVNGRLFLNNVSLGVYGDAVQRPEYRDAKLRTVFDTIRTVRGPGRPVPGLRFVDDRGDEHHDPAVVVVSNDPYAVHRPGLSGTRPSLASGRLGVLVLDRPDEAGRAHRGPGHSWTTPSFDIDAPGPVPAGIDGEALELEPPLRFRTMPSALRVRISARHPGVSPSGLLDQSRLPSGNAGT